MQHEGTNGQAVVQIHGLRVQGLSGPRRSKLPRASADLPSHVADGKKGHSMNSYSVRSRGFGE